MYFNVASDAGYEIFGYLIPDDFTREPSVTVHINGDHIATIQCDVYLETPHKLNHHATGVVGFRVTEQMVPDLRHIKDIEIADSESGFVFYRRLIPEQHIEKRVFRLETQFVPQNMLDYALKPWFQFFAPSVERLGAETIRQSFEIVNQTSTYVSGRVFLKWSQQYLTEDTVTFTALRDPYYEFAMRLITISQQSRKKFKFLSDRDVIIYQPAIEYFANMDFNNYDNIRAHIKNAPKDVLKLFESPFTHQLVAQNPSEKVTIADVATALQMLSQFHVFDPDEDFDLYPTEIADLLEISSKSLSIGKPVAQIQEIAENLKDMSTLEHLLENDLVLHHFVKKAETRR